MALTVKTEGFDRILATCSAVSLPLYVIVIQE